MHVEVTPYFLPSSPQFSHPSVSHKMNCGAVFPVSHNTEVYQHHPRVNGNNWKEISYFSQQSHHHSPRQLESTVPSLSPPSSNTPLYPFHTRTEPPHGFAIPSFSPKNYPPPPPFQPPYQVTHSKENFTKTPSPTQTPPSPFHPPSSPVYHTFVPYSPSSQPPKQPIFSPQINNTQATVLSQHSIATPPNVSLTPSVTIGSINNEDLVKQLEAILTAEHSECIKVRAICATIAQLTKDVLASGEACPLSFVSVLKNQLTMLHTTMQNLNVADKKKGDYDQMFFKTVSKAWQKKTVINKKMPLIKKRQLAKSMYEAAHESQKKDKPIKLISHMDPKEKKRKQKSTSNTYH